MAEEAPSPNPHAAEAEAALTRARALLVKAGPLDDAARLAALAALDDLRAALAPALEERPEQARSLSHLAEVVAHEATRREPSRSVLDAGLAALGAAAKEVERSRVTVIVERIAELLGQIGI